MGQAIKIQRIIYDHFREIQATTKKGGIEMEDMRTCFYGNGEEYKYDHNRFLKFYNEYKWTFKEPGDSLPVDVVLLQWVKAHGTRIPKVEIKKGDFVVAFSKDGRFSYSGFANGTVFNAGIELWKTEDGYVFNPDHQRLFICPSHLLSGGALNIIIPRTIEEAERSCQEVTG